MTPKTAEGNLAFSQEWRRKRELLQALRSKPRELPPEPTHFIVNTPIIPELVRINYETRETEKVDTVMG